MQEPWVDQWRACKDQGQRLEEENHQNQKLMEVLGGQVNRSTAPFTLPSSRKQAAPLVSCSRDPLHLNPLPLATKANNRILGCGPPVYTTGQGQFPAAAVHTSGDSTHGRQQKIVLQQVGLPQRKAQSCCARHSLTALIPVN